MAKVVILILAITLAGSGFAQEKPAADSKVSTSSSTSANFEGATKLSDTQKLEQATTFVSDMKEVLGHVFELLRVARREKDIIKINCVNEKLTNIKGLIRISEQADVTMQEALVKGEKDTATHEFHKISISHQKIRILRTEAEQCVGELAFAVGKTTVEVEKDPNQVPEDDPTKVALPETEVFRPPTASPYL
jgi:hypothetical protein